MLIPKHCSNPKCHKPYSVNDIDLYREVLVKLNCENAIRVISVCKNCQKDYNLEMAKLIMEDIMPLVIDEVLNDPKIGNMEKLARVNKLSEYKITAVGRDIDELNKNYGK